MNYNIAVVPGDGIGPEVIAETVSVLDKVGENSATLSPITTCLQAARPSMRQAAACPDETVEICRNSDAVLLGAVGGPKWDNLPGDERPERALLGLRKALASSRTCALPWSLTSWPTRLR